VTGAGVDVWGGGGGGKKKLSPPPPLPPFIFQKPSIDAVCYTNL